MSTSNYKVGQLVAAKWQDSFYRATVDEVHEERLHVTYTDGTPGKVGLDRIRPIVASADDLKVDDQVYAVWEEGKMYRGKIVKRNGTKFEIHWHDGSGAKDVPFDEIAHAG